LTFAIGASAQTGQGAIGGAVRDNPEHSSQGSRSIS
jgi:hypothetical protein